MKKLEMNYSSNRLFSYHKSAAKILIISIEFLVFQVFSSISPLVADLINLLKPLI